MSAPVRPQYPVAGDAEAAARRFLARRSQGIQSPEILRIAWEVRRLREAGHEIFDLTLGDFDPSQFAPPPSLVEGVARHLAAGRTNYPPAAGVAPLRRAVAEHYERRLGIRFPDDSILVGSGARPLIYSFYASTLEPGDPLVYAVPSWNNDYYAYLNGATPVAIEGRPEAGFLPTLDDVAPHLSTARVLHLNNPLNPAGTVMASEELTAICEAVVAENRRREALGARALLLLSDAVYWPLVHGSRRFHHPVGLVPEIAPFVVSIDAASKWMAATGLRVGWAVVPPHVLPKVKALGSHMGAWAPHAEQHAVAEVLAGDPTLDAYVTRLQRGLEDRLRVVYEGCRALQSEGHGVEAVEPQGALYLSIRLDLEGGRAPDGTLLEDAEAVRSYLLRHAGVGLIPFAAFGSRSHHGWYRASIAGLTVDRAGEAMAALGDAVRSVTR
jgi:aspartate aminotransferase